MVKVEGTIMLRLVIEVLRVRGSSPYERPLNPNSLNSLETIGWADGIESTSTLRYLSTTTGQAEKIFEERADRNHHYHCDTPSCRRIRRKSHLSRLSATKCTSHGCQHRNAQYEPKFFQRSE